VTIQVSQFHSQKKREISFGKIEKRIALSYDGNLRAETLIKGTQMIAHRQMKR